MWKRAYEKVKEQQRESKAASKGLDERVKAANGGFFEMLDEVLKKHAEDQALGARGAAEDVAQSFPLPEDAAAPPDRQETTALVSDALGSNIEALYLDVLHIILHTVGCEAAVEDKTSLFAYVQEAFRFDDDKHNELLMQAKIKEAPNILLHVEVVQAKDLIPMDVNGLSDTFCTLYLTSNKKQQYNTSVKVATLFPKWSEHFCLPVENPTDDNLCIELWDFDPAETVNEKIKKMGGVKGIRGWGKLVHEFAATGKDENEFIGSALVPLKSIHASGETRWCDIEKKGKTGRGSVILKLLFSSEKNTQATFKAHRNLLRLILLHHLESTKVEPYQWNGKFSIPAENILMQHLVQSGLSPIEDLLVKWIEYCGVHVNHPISFEVFAILLAKLIKALQNNMFDNEKEMLFWEATRKLMPSYLNGIRKLHTLVANDNNSHQLAALLRIISYLRCLKLPENFTLFSVSSCEWFTLPEGDNDYDFITITKLAVTQGALDWYHSIIDNNISDSTSTPKIRLTHLIKMVQDAVADLQKAIEIHDKIFQENIQLEYALTFFSAHECKISELAEPIIEEGYHILKPLKFTSELSTEEEHESEAVTLGIQLLDLYLTLKRFVNLGRELHPESNIKCKITDYYLWFHPSVAQWLDIALWKALQRIRKAVELDDLTTASNTVQYSSSATDIIDIFHQIKIFWENLSWPDIEGSYVFITRLVDDICRCSVFYAEVMSEKVERLKRRENTSENKFNISKEWCLAINNIDYVWHSLKPFVSKLGMEDITKKLTDSQNSSSTEHCKRTLELVVDNTVETVANKISELLETAAEKMMPAIKRYLLEGAEVSEQGKNSQGRLLQYLENNMMILYSELKNEIFQQILSVIWEKVANILSETVETSLEQKRPRLYYSNLQRTLEELVDFFSEGDEQQKLCNIQALQDVTEALALHSMETSQLVHKFYFERLGEQTSTDTTRCGLLTVRAGFVKSLLQIQILSCRNLQPMDSNGSCDPYVEINLLPSEQFIGIQKQRTKTHKKTLYPLFDETFTFHLTNEQRQRKDCMVLFTAKDQDFLSNEFIGEAFIPFTDIEEMETTKGFEEQEQVHLKLSTPKNLGSPVSKALKHREGDKLAKEFMKKQRLKAEAH